MSCCFQNSKRLNNSAILLQSVFKRSIYNYKVGLIKNVALDGILKLNEVTTIGERVSVKTMPKKRSLLNNEAKQKKIFE